MKYLLFFTMFCVASCTQEVKQEETIDFNNTERQKSPVSLYVLGTVQDGGSPHIGCQKKCCSTLFKNPNPNRKVVSLGVIDHEHNKSFLFEATPDMTSQLQLLSTFSSEIGIMPNGIFLTHAHIGHYTGLMYLGREALGAKSVPVHAMPRMKQFLETNGPWNQLVALNNITINPLANQKAIRITPNIKVEPFTVPHRDEYSETVGYKISGPKKSVLFIPDIDKWSKWEKDIIQETQKVDVAFLDASFYNGEEINARDINEIPHPFVVESLKLFGALPDQEKAKIHFIHFNHTNALLNQDSEASSTVRRQGFKIATFLQHIDL
ncbi:pyrroloquinoline quinone biosynthesis protein PqqB [Muricauda sp. JGD-17]|uniref:Pyrroloquinoline quinone biosynthesis protein PqqB n=1 Tax=Flagellimonas ochracea TaxID=2696472 RepID=A0A964WYL9_9FLAO|nr:MBL fold metallo-hydrolase [Allomuricauda ochracea]NAY93037.1 pyrroloquinoline quinone biosynthesis protein PqqB [Allomuricauda ochracea]